MDFSDEELEELHSVLYDEAYYGDDNIVYGSDGDMLRRVLGKVDDEAKNRKLWWAR
jgi:hypothetical protein